MLARCFHFIPASRCELFERALDLPTDALIFDLEDAVPETEKTAARASLERFLRAKPELVPRIYIRINGEDSPHHREDLALLATLPGFGVVYPKASLGEALTGGYTSVGPRPTMLLCEDFRSATQLEDLVAAVGPDYLGLGVEDMFSACDLPTEELAPLVEQVETRAVLACKACGVPIVAGIGKEYRDLETFRAQCLRARARGFDAMFSIHPAQVSVIREVFSVPPEQVRWARDLIAKAGDDPRCGYRSDEGGLVTPPMIRKALFILTRQEHHHATR